MSKPRTPSHRGGPTRHKKPLKRHRRRSSVFGFFLKGLLVLSVWGAVFACFALIWFTYDLPDVDKLQMAVRRPSVTIVSQEGKIIGTYGDLVEDMVRVQDLPPYVPQAFLAIEDRRFYSHFGIDIIGLVRAAYTNWKADRIVQGGSSITQQLAKNFLVTQGLYSANDRSLRRKVQEALMAIWLEWQFSKEQILTIYLNRVYFGAGTYGLDAASRKYFGKSAKQMNVFEAAVLAGLLKAPSKYSPASHPERAKERAKVVLQQMVEAGFIKDVDSYLNQETTQASLSSIAGAMQNVRFFTDWIYEMVPNYVSTDDRDLIVMTTLDTQLQSVAEEVALGLLREMAEQLGTSEIGVVTMTPDGAIKAFVGGADYNKNQFNHVTQAKRQPGSSFKIPVYLAALEAGLSPETLVGDTPIVIGKWGPKNFGRYEPQGEIPLKEALQRSVNTASVRLIQFVGPERVAQLAHRLGITTNMGLHPSLALGTSEVTLLEMTALCATLANLGRSLWPYGILEIRDKEGIVLYRRQPPPARTLIHPLHLRYMQDMLQNAVIRGTGNAANIGMGAAGKTGSNGDLDAWFIGYVPGSLVTGVWTGNDNNKLMKKISTGGRLPARVWAALMKEAIKYYPPQPHPLPAAAEPEEGHVERLTDLTHETIESFEDEDSDDQETLEQILNHETPAEEAAA